MEIMQRVPSSNISIQAANSCLSVIYHGYVLVKLQVCFREFPRPDCEAKGPR